MNFNRQWQLVKRKKIKPIGIIGAGSIGSWVAFLLAKMGASKIEVWDPDIVEEVNGPNQIYRPKIDIGKPKVVALKEIIKDFADMDISIHQEKYDGTRLPWIICSVDSMKERKKIFDNYIDNAIDIERYFDARMGGEYTTILSIKPIKSSDVILYRKFLFSQDKIVKAECGEESVVYLNAWIASFLCNQIKRLAMDMDVFVQSDFSWTPYDFSGAMTDKSFRYIKVKGS